jgi:hypothetical protein
MYLIDSQPFIHSSKMSIHLNSLKTSEFFTLSQKRRGGVPLSFTKPTDFRSTSSGGSGPSLLVHTRTPANPIASRTYFTVLCRPGGRVAGAPARPYSQNQTSSTFGFPIATIASSPKCPNCDSLKQASFSDALVPVRWRWRATFPQESPKTQSPLPGRTAYPNIFG